MLKRIFFPNIFLYGLFSVLLAVSLLRITMQPKLKTHSVSRTAPSKAASPSPAPAEKTKVTVTGTVKRISPRHFKLVVNVASADDAAIDAADFSLMAPRESVELTNVTPGIIPVCPKVAREGNYLNVTCSSDTDSLLSSQDRSLLTVDLYLREPYGHETVSANIPRINFYHNGRLVPSSWDVTEFTLTEP